MTTSIRLSYFGMDGEGPTVKEAKQDAGRKIERALGGIYTPTILRFGNEIALVYRTPWGYETSLITSTPDMHQPSSTSGYISKSDAIHNTRLNLAQLGWDGSNDADCIAYTPDCYKPRMRDWLDFQHAYKYFRANGDSETEAHRKACDSRERALIPA